MQLESIWPDVLADFQIARGNQNDSQKPDTPCERAKNAQLCNYPCLLQLVNGLNV